MRASPLPSRTLLHPLWLTSLAVLVANDHFLKGSGWLPPWLTGKLSDLAGMMVAPLLLAVLLRVESERSWWAIHAVVGAVFAGINLSPGLAHAFEWLTALTPLPWTIVVDPTDLLALPMLGWSLVAFAPRVDIRGRRDGRQLALDATLLGAGVLACMGTSPPPCDGECGLRPAMEDAALTLGNDTLQQRLVRLRPLKASIVADCATLLDDPTHALHRDMFMPAEAWLLEPGRALPLNPLPRGNPAACQAFLVDAQGLPMTLIAWDTATFPVQSLPTSTVDEANAPGRMMHMRQGDDELVVDAHVAVFEAPAEEPTEPEPTCRVPDATVGLDWSNVPTKPGTLVSIESSPDGCHHLELQNDSFYVCLPLATLPFELGETIDIRTILVTAHSSESGAPLSSTGIEMTSDSFSIRLARGQAPLATSADEDALYEVGFETQPGCAPHHDSCANLVTPLLVTWLGSDGVTSLRAGQAEERNDSGSTLFLVRAQRLPIRDTACTDFDVSMGDLYLETALVTPLTASN